MQNNLFQNITVDNFINLNKEELNKFFQFFEDQKNHTNSIIKEHRELNAKNKILEDKIIEIEGQLVLLKRRIFRKKSEKIVKDKTTSESSNNTKNSTKKRAKEITRLPSERYPEAEIIEENIELKNLPTCSCCQSEMVDFGITEDSEFLTIKPKDYYIIRQKRHKYRCTKCHGDIKTAPTPKKIIPCSAYSDEMIIDVAMTKYCDLIPIERYSAIAGREGLIDLPPNSLIGTTHKLAEYTESAYAKVKEEVLSSHVLHADETPHKMLEGSDKKNWYLWGFSNKNSSYFEIRNTRSGDVASEILNNSNCEYLVSDVFSGYIKSTAESNKIRKDNKLPLIKNVYCNAHSRRYFLDAEKYPEHRFYIEQYKEIYKLEAEGQEKNILLKENRVKMKSFFELMKKTGEEQLNNVPSKGLLIKAINYFLKNYEGLTRFIGNKDLPIDNNHQERQLRNAVIGRKTWYGTHSKQGAKTAAILFTLVESSKINGINPREYISKLIKHLHAGKAVFTPKEFKEFNLDSG